MGRCRRHLSGGGALSAAASCTTEFLDDNPDSADPRLNTRCGVYEPGCGLRNVHLSWGHDEYLYHVVTQSGCSLPEPALYMIRYHSFYPWHREEGIWAPARRA